jgi:dTDP-glucose 4,6-dehydratase
MATYLLGANGERTNLQVVAAILEAMGKPADFIEFVTDRPGHDLRYAIDASRTIAELGWQPQHTSFEQALPEVINYYTGLGQGDYKLATGDLSVGNQASQDK